jgi:preprotein translocase subunit SecD
MLTYLPTSASGQPAVRTNFLAVVLAAGLVSLYLHISYSTLALVLACIGAATYAWLDSPRHHVRGYHL